MCSTVSQRSNKGHPTGGYIHSSLCKLPGFSADVSFSSLHSVAQLLFTKFYIDSHLCFIIPLPISSVFLLCVTVRYLFPRQLLIPHFWNPRQQLEFRRLNHSHRVQHHRPVLKELEYTSHQVKSGHLQGLLKNLCAKARRCIRKSIYAQSIQCFQYFGKN